MRPTSRTPGPVVALRFDESSTAVELARWCGGSVTLGADGPLVDVPTQHGPRPASLGDWIVRVGDDDFHPCSPQDFAARYEPAPDEVVPA